MFEIWSADGNKPPKFDDALLSVAGALAGVLGSGFALALGVKKPDDVAPPSGRFASLKKKTAGISVPVTFGIWAYAIIGAAAAVTVITNLGESPEVLKALASVFAGYILAFASDMFHKIRT